MIGSRMGIQVTSKDSANNLCYSITKSAMHHLTKSLAVTLGPNIRVNAIAPGMIESARLTNKFNDIEELKQKFVNNSLLNNTVNINSLIDSIIFLADNSSITGQILSVCNGASVNKIS
jgi:3-oxoacyl-[acyl-carrier protein] reductase